MGKTGLFFGSFNPIHCGHLSIARYLLNEGYCEHIWFVISPQNPWKKGSDLLDEQKRLKMVRQAIGGDVRMKVCDVEFGLPRPSYTYQTLRKLQQDEPEQDFALIIGGDNLQKFSDWKNYQEILEKYTVFVYPRPGMCLPERSGAHVVVVDAPQTTLSSTEIRQKVRQGEDITGDVPESIRAQVERHYKN